METPAFLPEFRSDAMLLGPPGTALTLNDPCYFCPQRQAVLGSHPLYGLSPDSITRTSQSSSRVNFRYQHPSIGEHFTHVCAPGALARLLHLPSYFSSSILQATPILSFPMHSLYQHQMQGVRRDGSAS